MSYELHKSTCINEIDERNNSLDAFTNLKKYMFAIIKFLKASP